MTKTLNLTAELERLIADVAGSLEEFQHIEPQRVLVCVNSGRNSRQGTYAKIHPLRFAGGTAVKTVRSGRRRFSCMMPEVSRNGTDILYVIYFTLPRFMNRSLRDKLVTVFHELYHISPFFDGDIRRFPGKNFAHGSSVAKYNLLMASFVDRYLHMPGRSESVAFLDADMDGLRQRHSAIVGRRMAMPRITLQQM